MVIRYFHRMLFGMLSIVAIGLPFSLSRWPETGFLPAYVVHILISAWIFIVFLMRNKVRRRVIIQTVLLPLIIISVTGALTFGLQSPTVTFAVFSAFIGATAWGIRAGIYITAAFVLFYVLVGYGYWSGQLALSIDPTAYARSFIGWLSNPIVTIIISTFLLIASSEVLITLRKMVLEIHAHKEEIAAHKKEIEHLANHDALTGLPTLRMANQQMETAVALAGRGGYKTGLLFLDLDGFKKINDTHGHEAGDDVLKAIAERLVQTIRSSDTACRVGGDEFLVLLARVGERKEVEDICKRMIEIVSEPVIYEEKELVVGVSIGAALYPDHATNAKELRNAADELMYEVKRSGKNNYKFAAFEPESVGVS